MRNLIEALKKADEFIGNLPFSLQRDVVLKAIMEALEEAEEERLRMYADALANRPVKEQRSTTSDVHETRTREKDEQPAQKPIAWTDACELETINSGDWFGAIWAKGNQNTEDEQIPLYTHPAPSCSCKDKK